MTAPSCSVQSRDGRERIGAERKETLMPQEQKDTMVCGCGKQFTKRDDFDRHAKECPMAQAARHESSDTPKTRTAG